MLYEITCEITYSSTVWVEAEDEEQAKELFNDLDWDDVREEDVLNWDIKEIKPEK